MTPLFAQPLFAQPLIAQLGPDWLITWLTPLWILGVGALLGLVGLVLIWLLVLLISRRRAFDILEMLGESALLPILITTLVFGLFGILGAFFVRTPEKMIGSLPRFMSTGSQMIEREVPMTNDTTFEYIDLNYSVIGEDLSYLSIESDQPIYIRHKIDDQTIDGMIEVTAGERLEWIRGKDSQSPIGDEEVNTLAIANLGGTDATVKLTVNTRPVYPQTWAMIVTALCVISIFLVYVLQQVLFPKMSAIALATCKSEMAQPMFAIMLGLGAFALFIFMIIPYNTFGEDIKMLKDSGFTTIMILGIIQAVWAASKSVSEEIEGKTALTVLSKPVGRRSFVFGKFAGIVWTVAVLFVVLGAWFMVLVSYKPIYDARESSKVAPIWEDAYVEVVNTTPGLALAFMETVVLAAVSVAISTRLPLLANFAICFSIYALGHLTPLIVQSSVGNLPPVAFMGLFISAVLPMLEAFNIQAAVAAGKEVPMIYLGTAFLYCCLYSLVAMLLALFLFEDRDLA